MMVASPGVFPKRQTDLRVRLHIEARHGVIENHDRRVQHQGAGDGDALLLPAGQRHPPLPDNRVVAV